MNGWNEYQEGTQDILLTLFEKYPEHIAVFVRSGMGEEMLKEHLANKQSAIKAGAEWRMTDSETQLEEQFGARDRLQEELASFFEGEYKLTVIKPGQFFEKMFNTVRAEYHVLMKGKSDEEKNTVFDSVLSNTILKIVYGGLDYKDKLPSVNFIIKLKNYIYFEVAKDGDLMQAKIKVVAELMPKKNPDQRLGLLSWFDTGSKLGYTDDHVVDTEKLMGKQQFKF